MHMNWKTDQSVIVYQNGPNYKENKCDIIKNIVCTHCANIYPKGLFHILNFDFEPSRIPILLKKQYTDLRIVLFYK